MSKPTSGLAAKPVKPKRAWAVVNEHGQFMTSIYDTPFLRQTKREASDFCSVDDEGRRYFRPVRVTITVEDGQ